MYITICLVQVNVCIFLLNTLECIHQGGDCYQILPMTHSYVHESKNARNFYPETAVTVDYRE